MKLKKLLTKSLLVAAGLLTGANSWADVTTIYERGTTKAWSNDDLTDWTPSTTSEYLTYAINGGLSLGNTSPNGNLKSSYSATKSITTTENAIVTLKATLKAGGAPGRSGSYDYVKIGGVTIGFNEQDKKAILVVDGTSSDLFTYSNRSAAYDITIEINQASGAISYTIGSTNGTSTSTTAITEIITVR